MPRIKTTNKPKTQPKQQSGATKPSKAAKPRIDYKKRALELDKQLKEMTESEKRWRKYAKDSDHSARLEETAANAIRTDAREYKETHTLHNLVSLILGFALFVAVVVAVFK